jgi:asparagine synthase (glutamine-hydrolysing)
MCGIAGFVEFGGHAPGEARERVLRMTRAIAHRGPDAESCHVDGFAALGHRRLSIIDVENGAQPMAALDGAVQLVFNGEIYNFRELRAELEACGHAFVTRSDTEVVLRAWLEWGEAAIARLNGMFALALWDARRRSLLLARDRFGEKPLFYARTAGGVAFASELKALRAAGGCHGALDPESVDCYLTLGYVPAPRSIFRGVRKLRPGQWLRVSPAGDREETYWQPRFGPARAQSMDAAAEEFEALLIESVRCRMVSDVPLGAFLSGGLDSSLVVWAMSQVADGPVLTHSIGPEDGEGELPLARAVAAQLGTRHEEFRVGPEVETLLPTLVHHLDEPLADSSALPTWHVSRMTRRNVTVALSGDGGDEAFGGYTARYLPHLFESRLRAALPAGLRRVAFGPLARAWPASARLPRPLRLRTIFGNLAVDDARAYFRDLAWLEEEARAALYSAELRRALRGFTPFEVVGPRYAADAAAPDALARSQLADIGLYMTDDVLAKVDRMSMAHGLEVRCPFLDPRILEFAGALPPALKLGRRDGKRLLRHVAARRLPRPIATAPKQGFSIPAASWLRGPLVPAFESRVLARDAGVNEWVEPSAVLAMWREHQSGARDHSVPLWALMCLATWLALPADGSPP